MQKPNDLASLNVKYDELLNSSLATWLFLDLTKGEFSGQIDISTISDDNLWSFMRFLPRFSTVATALFDSLSSDGTNLCLNEPKAYARACGMMDVSPVRVVQVTTVISNERGTAGVLLVKVQEFMQLYRARCVAQYTLFANECRQQNAIIMKLILLAIQNDSSLCSELQDLLQKFSNLEMALLDQDDFKQYSPNIKKIIEQHYLDLEILLNQWEKAKSECIDRTQIWRLKSVVQFFGILLGDPSLISYVKYEKGLTYHEIGHRQALEYRLLHLQLTLHHNDSANRAALREGYHMEIEKLLDGRESYVKLLYSVCIDPAIDEQGLLEGYEAISQVLCYMDICNREQAPKKLLFQDPMNNVAMSTDLLLRFSEAQINELKAFQDITVVVVLLTYLKAELRTKKYGVEIKSILDSHGTYFALIFDLIERIARIQCASSTLDVQPVKQQLYLLIMTLYNQFQQGSEKICGFIDSKCAAIKSRVIEYITMSKMFFDANILDKTKLYLDNIQVVFDLENQVKQLMGYSEKYVVLKLAQKELSIAIFQRVELVTSLRGEIVEQYKLEYLHWMQRVVTVFQCNPTSMQELHAAQTLLKYCMVNRDALLERLQSIVPSEVRQQFIEFERWLSKITVQSLNDKLLMLSKSSINADSINTLRAKRLELVNKIKLIPGLYGVLCRYLAVVGGSQDLQLSSEVNATCNTLIAIESEMTSVINEYSMFGENFSGDVSFLQEMLLQTRTLIERYNDAIFLINNTNAPNYRVVPRITPEAKSELTLFLGEIRSVLSKSNAEFADLSNSIALNCNNSADSSVNDLALLLDNMTLNNIDAALVRSWITRFITDYKSCNNLIQRLKEYCNQMSLRIQDDDEPLGDVLAPLVLATFSQIGFRLDYNARRNQYIQLKLEEKLNNLIAADVPTNSM